jgi:TonB-linked SusC/RagA family outer membrane protein
MFTTRLLCVRSILCSLLFFLLSLPTFAQEKIVTGKITDSKDGSPVVGATVSVKNSSIGTSTGSDGTFKLTVPEKTKTLVITSVGFGMKEVSVTGNDLQITLSNTNAALNEVVIIGYGTARKKDLTGAVAVVGQKDFVRGPITTPEQLIAGKVPGVQVTPNSGLPGSGSRIRIRGGTSLNASNDPLIVIDGVPLDNGRIDGAPNPLSLINPNDIESFNILKDASAAAIYGSRAANGVILITTKKGSTGNLKIDFSTLNSISKRTGEIDVLSTEQFKALVNQRGSASEKALLGTENTNWQDQIYQTAFSTDNNISVSGGIAKVPYRLSLGYLNQDGILKGSNLARTSVALNVSPKFLDNHLGVNANLKYSNSKNVFANTNAIGAAVLFDPTKPVYSGKPEYGGYWEWLSSGTTLNGTAQRNPVGLLNDKDDRSNVNRFIGNVQLDYKFHFLPDLRANLNLGMDKSKGEGDVFVPASAAQDYTRGGRMNHYEQESQNKLLEFYLNYVKDLKAISSRIDLTGGYSYQDWITKRPAFPDLRADGSVFKAAGIPFETQNTLISFYGRLNYALMDKYLLTFTMRRDGSSRFSEENRWGNFPSAAVAWKVSDENFLRNSNVISNLKLRLGWGITGQQDGIGDYGYQSNIFYGDSAAQYQLGNGYTPVARPQGYDKNLKWEETESRNVGLDLGFANNRYNFTIDYYEKETSDLLASVPAPAGTNFTNIILTNIGSIKNKGLEFGMNINPVNSKNFNLDLGYNITYIMQNEITRLQLVNDPTYLGAETGSIGINGNIQIHSVGYRPSTFFLYRQVYDAKGKPVENVFEDQNGDGVINERDKNWVKNPEPKVYMGFSANATYKKFGAGFSMRAHLGNYMYNNVKAGSGIWQNISTGAGFLNNAQADILVSGFNSRQTWSDYYLQNASFLKMDNAYVNYDFGKVTRHNVHLRVSFNIQNAFVITKYDGMDPEVNGGIDGSIYPRPRMYALGLQLGL